MVHGAALSRGEIWCVGVVIWLLLIQGKSTKSLGGLVCRVQEDVLFQAVHG